MSGTALQALYNHSLPSAGPRFIAKELRQSRELFKSSYPISQRTLHLSRDLVMITSDIKHSLLPLSNSQG